jgi:hypothetical protein
MNTVQLSRLIFTLAGIYDGFLGIVFLFVPLWVFELFQVPPPNHLGYVQFPAALLIIFAIMFFQIAQEPSEKVILMPYGMGLKFAYSTLVFWYWLFSDLPNMWKPFAIADLAFLVGFIWCYYTLISFPLNWEQRKKVG